MIVVVGNIVKMGISGQFDVLVHGCNCFCQMGAGVADQIKKAYPSAYIADCQTATGDRSKLGSYTQTTVEYMTPYRELTIVNAYTQFKYGSGKHVDYDAIACAFHSLAEDFRGKRIAYPRIGAGLAGGDWNIISKIINRELTGCQHMLVVY